MGKIAILMGNHTVGFGLAHAMLKNHSDRIAFIEHQEVHPIIWRRCKRLNVCNFAHTNEAETAKHIAEYNVTTVILAWWPKIVKKINGLDGVTVINTHPSLLPYNRGKHPYYWAVYEGSPFGVTIHRVDSGVDTGAILWQRKIELTPLDTGESAYNKSVVEMLQLLYDHLDNIAYERLPEALPQNEEVATFHHSSEFEVDPIRDDNGIYDGYHLIQDCRARTFDNNWSGRRIEINGKMYRIHLNLVEERNEEV